MSSSSDPLSTDLRTKTAVQRLQEALVSDEGSLLEDLISRSGAPLLHGYLEYLSKTFGMRYAFFGELAGQDLDWIRTISVEGPGRCLPNFEYSLAKTPCQQVINQKTCCYPSGVQKLFPEDTMLQEMGVESYLGVSLHDQSARPLGLVVLLDDKAMPEDLVTAMRETLTLFLPRAIVELEHRRLLSDMQRIREAEEAARPDRLGMLAVALAKSLHVRVAFVVRVVPEDSSSFESLAISVDGVAIPTSRCMRRGTPFEHLEDRAGCFIESGVRNLYPEDEFLAELEAESYY